MKKDILSQPYLYKAVIEKDKLLNLMDRCYSKVAREDFNGKEAAVFIWGAIFSMETEDMHVKVENVVEDIKAEDDVEG